MPFAADAHDNRINLMATPQQFITQRLQSTHHTLRLQTLVRLRWFTVFGQLVTVLFVYIWLGFELPLTYCVGLIALSAWVNLALRLFLPRTQRLSNSFGTWLLAYDVTQLFLMLYLTGGLLNPFALLMIAPVIVSAAALPVRYTLLLGCLSTVYATLLLSWHFPLPWHSGSEFVLPQHYLYGIWSAFVCGLVFITAYVHRLSREAYRMSEALAATELVIAREDRLQALDGLAAAAAHELGTPLSTIAVISKELSRSLERDHPAFEDVEVLREQVGRCREILLTLTDRTPEGDPVHASMRLTSVIEEAVTPYRELGKVIAVSVHAEPDARNMAAQEPVCERSPGMLYGLGNIVKNAVEFANQRVDIIAQWDGRRVRIVVSDDGPGFASSIMDTLGEPYLTTRPTRRADGTTSIQRSGLGLGFFIAKTLLSRTSAELDVTNRPPPGRGAIVAITWPRDQFEQRSDETIETKLGTDDPLAA